MNKGKRRETNFDEQQELGMEVCPQRPSGHRALKVLGLAAAAIAAVGLVTQWQDIRRYLRIVRM